MSDAKIAYFDSEGRAVFRASAVNKCTKALVASLLGYDAMSPPEKMQKRFDAGHTHEPELLAYVRDHGWTLYGAQMELAVPLGNSIIINGHPDSLASNGDGHIALVEAKTMAPDPYDVWLSKRFTGSDLFRHYADQTSIYWESIKPDVLLMVVGRKEELEDGSTRIDAIDMSMFFEPPASTARIKARLAKVVNQANTGGLPDGCDSKDYPCPFYPLHDEEVKQYAMWSHEEELDEFALAMERYLTAQKTKSAGEKEQKAAKKDIDRILDGATEGQSNRFVVEYVPSPRSTWDEDAMRADGVDVDKYKRVTDGSRINVKELT